MAPLLPRSAIQLLKKLALGGLPQMYDAEKQLFCYGAKRNGDALVRYGLSRTNTLITLIGIRKAELAGHSSPIEITPALENLRNSVSRFDRLGS